MLQPLEYLLSAVSLFETDPADTDYQRGYEAALKDVLREAFGEAI